MTTRIYVAAASDPRERARVRAVMALVKHEPGCSLTHDWLTELEAQPPGHETDLPLIDQQRIVRDCYAGVALADIVWLLVPPRGVATSGAWCEWGAASWRTSTEARPPVLVASGPKRSVFQLGSPPGARGSAHVFADDGWAWDFVRAVARGRS